MRIISGSAKGKKIFNPVDKNTRPLKDMVKESIFNILNHSNLLKADIKKTIVLDLFSGVGSFGLETLSRGSKKVIFFEHYKPAIDLLKKNLLYLDFYEKAEIINKNIYTNHIFKNLNFKFNLIFIDPPFKDNNINSLLNKLENSEILNKNTLVVIHRHKLSKDLFPEKFKVEREEIYGSSKIIFGFFIF